MFFQISHFSSYIITCTYTEIKYIYYILKLTRFRRKQYNIIKV